MTSAETIHIDNFCMAGINYKKSDVAIRGLFAITPDQYPLLLAQARSIGIQECFVLSTCNRTEIYAGGANTEQLLHLLSEFSSGDHNILKEVAYKKKGQPAVEHFFRVGAGLDSQILGDYEIVGQIKQAVNTAKKAGMIGAFCERMTNCMLQASKAIKNNTALSGGTVSVSFSAVQYIREQVRDLSQKKILLIGTGKIGRNTCRNLVDYCGTRAITLVNRTDEKARELAEGLGLHSAPWEQLPEAIAESDIIVVATHAPAPLISTSSKGLAGEKLLIDLSIPCNVDPLTAELPGITLVNVDSLSRQKDQTLRERKAAIPAASEILRTHLSEFNEWSAMRKHVPVLRAIKSKLHEIYSSPLFVPIAVEPSSTNLNKKIQQVINGTASKMKTVDRKGCYYIEAINEFMATGTS